MRKKLAGALAIFLTFCVAFSGLPFLAGNLEANALAKKKKTPKNITLQAAASGQTQAVLKWNKIKSPSKGYAVFRDGEPVKHFNTKKIAFTDSNLKAGTSYTYQIKTYTKKTVKMWFNKKTEKWQKKKPAKKYRGKSRKETVYTYKKKSNAVTIHTAAAPAPVTPSTPSDPTDTGDSDTGTNDNTGGNGNTDNPSSGGNTDNPGDNTGTGGNGGNDNTGGNTDNPSDSGNTDNQSDNGGNAGNDNTGGNTDNPSDSGNTDNQSDNGGNGGNDSTGDSGSSDSVQENYTITWVNWNGKVLATGTVKAGEVPSYSGTNPRRSADSNHVYSFKGWTPAITVATADTTYKAEFTAIPRYTITWKNWDGTVLDSLSVREGTKPVYTRSDPTRPADDKYIYTFKGWDPPMKAATSDTTYVAQYDALDKNSEFTVTWRNWDGTVLKTDTVKAGVTPAYAANNPTRPSDDTYRYIFSGWTPDIVPAMKDVSYYAQYQQKDAHVFTVRWADGGSGNVLETDEVKEGETPTYDGPTPTKEPTKYENYTVTYTFAGWDAYIEKASRDITYFSEFKENITDIKPEQSDYYYNIRFLNEPYGNSEFYSSGSDDYADGDGTTVFYLDTNNTDETDEIAYSLMLIDSNGRECSLNGGPSSRNIYGKYADVDASKPEKMPWVCKPVGTGNCKFIVIEYNYETYKSKVVKEIPVYLRDWNAEEKAWRKSVIEEATDPSMTNAEKMYSICAYIEQRFRYFRVLPDEPGYLMLIKYEGVPYWIDKRGNSFTTPALLVEFGKDLGYPLHNCYGDYEVGTKEWKNFHSLAYSEEDDKYFRACPALSTGYYTDPIEMFDPATYHFWGE